MTRSIIKDATRFTISGYIATASNFISAVIVRKLLDPMLMGFYSELLLIFEYAKNNHLGILDSLDRQLPYYSGRQEFDKVDEVKTAGISFSLFMSIICAVAITAYSYIMKGAISPILANGLKVVAILVVAQSMTTFYVTLVRANHLFGPLSRYVVLIALFDIIFKAVLGIRFGMIGILWATVITLGLGLLYLYRASGMRFRISARIKTDTLKALFTIGFPLLLAGFAFMVLRSIDRLTIIAFLTKEDLGLYSIAVMVHSFAFQFPNLIYTVLFPRFYEAFGREGGDMTSLKGFLEKPVMAFSYLFPILIGLAVITLPVFVAYVLPKYLQGIPAATILLFGTFFISVTNMHGYLLVALKKQASLVIIGVVSIILCALLNLLFAKVFHLGIEGIALATSVAYFLYSLLILGYAMHQYVTSRYGYLRFLISVYGPLLWVAILLSVLRLSFHYNFKDLKGDAVLSLVQICLFIILTIPLIVSVNRKTDLYKRICDAGFKFFKR